MWNETILPFSCCPLIFFEFRQGVSKRRVMTFAWRPGWQYDVAAMWGADSALASDCRAQLVVLQQRGNARLFTKCLFTIFVPLNPPLPTSKKQNDGFPLEFLSKGPQTELRILRQNCEQTLPNCSNKQNFEQTGVSFNKEDDVAFAWRLPVQLRGETIRSRPGKLKPNPESKAH